METRGLANRRPSVKGKKETQTDESMERQGEGDETVDIQTEQGETSTQQEERSEMTMQQMFEYMQKELTKTIETNITKVNKELTQTKQDIHKELSQIEKKIEDTQYETKRYILEETERIAQQLTEQMISIRQELVEKGDKDKQDVILMIEEERNIRVEHVETLRDSISNKFEEVDGKIQDNSGKIDNVERRLYDTTIGYNEHIEKRLEAERKKFDERINNIQITNIPGCHHSESTIKFNGNIKTVHPCIFVNSMKNKMRNITNLEDIKDRIRNNLIDSALVWFTSTEVDIRSFEDFENLFLEYFWGELQQSEFREQLYFGKYNYNKNTNFVDYVLKYFAIAKFMKPAMQEEEIVLNVARHFKPEVVETISLQNIKTMNNFVNYIKRMQRTRVNKYESNNQSQRYERNDNNNNSSYPYRNFNTRQNVSLNRNENYQNRLSQNNNFRENNTNYRNNYNNNSQGNRNYQNRPNYYSNNNTNDNYRQNFNNQNSNIRQNVNSQNNYRNDRNVQNNQNARFNNMRRSNSFHNIEQDHSQVRRQSRSISVERRPHMQHDHLQILKRILFSLK